MPELTQNQKILDYLKSGKKTNPTCSFREIWLF